MRLELVQQRLELARLDGRRRRREVVGLGSFQGRPLRVGQGVFPCVEAAVRREGRLEAAHGVGVVDDCHVLIASWSVLGLGRPRRLLLLQTSAGGGAKAALYTNSARGQLCRNGMIEISRGGKTKSRGSIGLPPPTSSWGTSLGDTIVLSKTQYRAGGGSKLSIFVGHRLETNGGTDSINAVRAASTAATGSHRTVAEAQQHRAAARGVTSKQTWAARTKPHR